MTYEEVAILTKWQGACNISAYAQRYPGRAFMIYNGSAYMHDPRMRSLDLSTESRQSSASQPTDGASGEGRESLGRQHCMSIPKTYLNAASCAPSPSCITYTPVSIPLENDNLRTIHTVAHAYVYAVTGLPMDANVRSPCIGVSRWMNKSALACGADETPLDAETKATLSSAIRSSTDASNPFVRDAVASSVAGGSCTTMSDDGVSPIGAKVEVDGSCWEHVHHLSLNVYEMNQWADSGHPGNAAFDEASNPIKAFARNGQTTLTYPASHDLSRFTGALGRISLLGKLGDAVEFRTLPAKIQIQEIAEAFDALEIVGSVDACGSPGEVANVPLLGNHFVQDFEGHSRFGYTEQAYAPLRSDGEGSKVSSRPSLSPAPLALPPASRLS